MRPRAIPLALAIGVAGSAVFTGHAAAAFSQPLRWLAPVLKDVAQFLNETPPALE